MIIDHIDNLELQSDEVEQYFNELQSLQYLSIGLSFLSDQVQELETIVRNRIGKDHVVEVYGNHPDLNGIPQELVACSFHWYSVTACNYVRLVGWLVSGGNKKKAKEYLQRVLPEVYIWRNKVGAHFARFDPRNDDTPADLANSVIFPISFSDDAFYANRLRLSIKSRGQTSSSRQDMSWSLTRTHEQLSARYGFISSQ